MVVRLGRSEPPQADGGATQSIPSPCARPCRPWTTHELALLRVGRPVPGRTARACWNQSWRQGWSDRRGWNWGDMTGGGKA